MAVGLLERGLGAASSEVGTLRLGEVDTLAELYRDRLKQPEKAKELYRSWLEDQRKHRLSPRDAEGRLALALQYENLLDDRPTSLTLLRDAWAIDPQSPQLRDAFLRRGFRKVGGDWVEGPKTRAASETSSDAFKREKGTEDAESGGKAAVDEASPRITAGPSDDSLIGATPAQVLAKLSKPDRRARLATGGKLIEQWVYFVAGGKQYINILHGPLVPQPRVISFHFLPQTSSEAP